jgi:hypothetical protein
MDGAGLLPMQESMAVNPAAALCGMYNALQSGAGVVCWASEREPRYEAWPTPEPMAVNPARRSVGWIMPCNPAAGGLLGFGADDGYAAGSDGRCWLVANAGANGRQSGAVVCGMDNALQSGAVGLLAFGTRAKMESLARSGGGFKSWGLSVVTTSCKKHRGAALLDTMSLLF